MKQNQYIVALELGSSKIVGVVAEKLPGGQVTVTNVYQEQMSNCVHYGIVQNIENVKGAVTRIIKAIETFVDGSVTSVYVGLAGRSLHNHLVEVERSVDSTRAITQDAVNGLMAEAKRTMVRNHEVIGASVVSFSVDGIETRTPVGQMGSRIKATINLIVAKSRVKGNMDHALSSGAGSNKSYLITAMAMGNNLLSKDELELGCLLVDIGAETTTLSFYRNSALQLLTTLPMGGHNITRDIAVGMNVVEETAEKIKKTINGPLDANATNPGDVIEGVKSSEATNFIIARTDDIINNIGQQITDAGIDSANINSIVLAGGAALMPGLVQRLEDNFKAKTRLASMPATITLRSHAFNKPEFVQAAALVAEAAAQIGDGSCIERNVFETPEFVATEPVREEKPEPKAEDEDDGLRRKKQPSWKDRMLDKLRNLFTEEIDDSMN